MPGADVVFPQLFRVRGLDPKSGEPMILYSADHLARFGLTEEIFEPIETLQPSIDSGWVHIRHHECIEDAQPYLDALQDACEDWMSPFGRAHIFGTEHGLFTVLHKRPAVDFPDHLILYTCKKYDPDMELFSDLTYAVRSTGEVFEYKVAYMDTSYRYHYADEGIAAE
jgi:hypothetical protein